MFLTVGHMLITSPLQEPASVKTDFTRFLINVESVDKDKPTMPLWNAALDHSSSARLMRSSTNLQMPVIVLLVFTESTEFANNV